MRKLLVALAISAAGIVPGAVVFAGTAGAATTHGTTQYGTTFPISTSGHCHGAFANINGNFGVLGALGGAVGGGVPAGPGTTGYNNSAVSGDCPLG